MVRLQSSDAAIPTRRTAISTRRCSNACETRAQDAQVARRAHRGRPLARGGTCRARARRGTSRARIERDARRARGSGGTQTPTRYGPGLTAGSTATTRRGPIAGTGAMAAGAVTLVALAFVFVAMLAAIAGGVRRRRRLESIQRRERWHLGTCAERNPASVPAPLPRSRAAVRSGLGDPCGDRQGRVRPRARPGSVVHPAGRGKRGRCGRADAVHRLDLGYATA